MSAPLEEFPSAENSVRGKFLLALALAVGVHAGAYVTSRFVPVESISPSFYNKVVPRNFTLKQVDVDPSTLAEAEPKATPRPKPKPLTDISALDAKQPSLDEMMSKADQVIAAPCAQPSDPPAGTVIVFCPVRRSPPAICAPVTDTPAWSEELPPAEKSLGGALFSEK